MKYTFMLYLSVLLFLFTQLGFAQPPQPPDEPEDSLSAPPPMNVQDVIDLAKSGVSDSIIIDQIHASRAWFDMNTDNILDLKRNDVSESVIDAMIATRYQSQESTHPQKRHFSGYYAYGWYPPFYPYYRSPYWSHFPRYVRGPGHFGFHGGVHFNGGSRFNSGFHGGGRSIGRHR